jgi:CHASE1-domain containing sensor protein
VLDGGGSADLLVIKYIEPLALNRADWGYDIVQDAVFLEAADMARLSGDITLSGRVLLRQTNSTTPGL